MKRLRHEEMERWRDGETNVWRHAEMKRCRNGEMQKWRDAKDEWLEGWRDGEMEK